MKKKKNIIVLMIFTIIITIYPTSYPTSIVKADILGGKWTSDFNCYIHTQTYYGYSYNAILIWNNILDTIGCDIDIGTSVYSYSVNFYETNNSAVSWLGLTNLYPSINSSVYNGADIQYNDYYLQDYPYTIKNNVAIHEMGHVLGLGETSNWNNNSIMITDQDEVYSRGITSPTAYDISELDYIY